MIRREGRDVVLDVDAYVHVSEGAPGVDPGTVWKQPVRIIADDGSIQREFDGDSLLIADGAIRTGEGTLHNVLALGLEIAGRVELELVGAEGKLTVMGAQLHIEPAGDATYVERFA